MCGHWEITENQRCASCGEPVVGSDLEISLRPRRSIFNLRSIIGFFVMVIFGAAFVWNYLKSRDMLERDRQFRQLLGIAPACGALIGLTVMLQGIIRALRSRDEES